MQATNERENNSKAFLLETEKNSNIFLSETVWRCINTLGTMLNTTLTAEDDSRAQKKCPGPIKNVWGPGERMSGPGVKILKTNNRTDASAGCLGRPWIRDSGENVQCALGWNKVEKGRITLQCSIVP